MKDKGETSAAVPWGQDILTICFIALLAITFILNLLNPSRELSERENRPLRQAPLLNWQTFFEGSFSKSFEEYISDQFILRNAWVGLKTTTQLLLGRRDNNGVYYGSGRRLYEIAEIDEKIFYSNLAALESLAVKSGLPASILPVPSAALIQPDGLPKHAAVTDEQEYWRKAQETLASFNLVPSIEVLMNHSAEYLYYYSDHHWTTLGAYYVYSALMNAWQMEQREITDYRVYTAADHFLGALHSKSAYTFVRPDRMIIFSPDIEVVVDYPDSGKKTDTLFAEARLAGKDKYAVFLDGNHALVTIKSSEGQGKLLVLKDSFANSLVPLMAGQFEEIHMIDLRYFRGSVPSYIENNDFTEMLAVYHAASLGRQSFSSQLH